MPDELENGTSPIGTQSTGAIVAVPTRQSQLPATTWSYGPPATPEIINAKPGPMELLHALRRRWMVAAGLGLLVGGALAALVWFLVPIRQEVVALLRVMATPPSILKGSNVDEVVDYAIYKRTQAALFKSNFVLQATLRKPEVKRLKLVQQHKDDVLDWLAGQITVDYPGDSEIMRVAMRGERPDEMKTIVNAVKDSYMDEIVNAERVQRLKQRDNLERLYRKNREEIRTRFDQLIKLHRDINSTGDPSTKLRLSMLQRQLDSLVGHRSGLQNAIADMEMKILLIKARAEKGDEIEIPDFIIDRDLASDPQISQIKKSLSQIGEMLVEEERRVKNPNAPSLARLRQQAQLLQEQLEARREELRPTLVEIFKYTNQGQDPIAFLPLLETEREALVANLDGVNKSIEKELEEMQTVDRGSSELEAKSAELKELQEVTQQMGAELKMRTYSVDSPQRIQSIEDASSPSGSDAVRKYVAVGFAGVTGFAAVLFCVAFMEFQARRLNSERDVREGLGIRVIGHLPSLSGRKWRKLADATSAAGAHLQSLLAESVDSIRATLMHSNGANPPRVIMVSSSDTQEGKTTVASQLAASLARAGRRTLLVDGDLRNPTAHAVFGLPLDPGFAEVLRGDAEREAAVYATPATNLWLMPAGQYDNSAVQAISTETLVKLVKSLREQYDFVIVDAPPVLKVADPMILGQCVDAAVLSVRCDYSRIPQIYEAGERLSAVGVKVLGAIVNGVNEKPMRRPAPIQL